MDTKSLCVSKGEKVWMVQVDVVPVNFDGNLITIGGFAALAALLNARFPFVKDDGKVDYHQRTDKKLQLAHQPIPLTIGKIGQYLVIDPTQEEEAALDARLTITVMEDGRLCALQKSGSSELTVDNIKAMAELAIVKSGELRKKLLEALV
jgi:exosome complex component RRP42